MTPEVIPDPIPKWESSLSNETLPDSPLLRKWPLKMISSLDEFEQLCERLGTEKIFSVDTETWGPKGERLDKILCLLQIGIPKSDQQGIDASEGEVFLVDILALQEEASRLSVENNTLINPLESFRSVVESEEIHKVIHHAPFERAQFAKYGLELRGEIDTERLGKRVRPDLKRNYSLAALSVELLNIPMSKEEQTSDWSQRPLSLSQIEYAYLDGVYTMMLYAAEREIEKAAEVDPQLGIEQLFERYVESRRELSELLMSETGRRYAALEYEEQVWRLTLKEELLRISQTEGEKEFGSDFGTARVSQRKDSVLDLVALRDHFPEIAGDVVKETVTKAAFQGALEELGISKGERRKLEARIFPPSEEEDISLKIEGGQIAEIPSGAEPEADLALAAGLTPEEMLRKIVDVIRQRQELARSGFGNSRGAKLLEISNLEERMAQAMEEEVPRHSAKRIYTHPQGKLTLTYRRKPAQVDSELFRSLFPQLAEELLESTVRKEDLERAFQKRDFETYFIEEILDRLYQRKGELKSTVGIYPAYRRVYDMAA